MLRASRRCALGVVATLALFLALGGAAYAAFHLPNDSVRSKHIKNGQVKTADVQDNGLTGTDILESSLGPVPQADQATSADQATNADRVGGMTAGNLDYAAGESASTALTDFGTIGLLTFDAFCHNEGSATTLEVAVHSPRAGMDLMSTESFGNGTQEVYGSEDLDQTADTNALLAYWTNTSSIPKVEQIVVSGRVPGTLILPGEDETVTLMLAVAHGASGSDCSVHGTGIAG